MTFDHEPCPDCGLDTIVMMSCFWVSNEPEPNWGHRYEPNGPGFHVCRNWDDMGGIGEDAL
jgi:hypothetical protein